MFNKNFLLRKLGKYIYIYIYKIFDHKIRLFLSFFPPLSLFLLFFYYKEYESI